MSKVYQGLEGHPFNVGQPKEMKVGQLAWVPVQFIQQIPWIMDTERKTPSSHTDSNFEVRQMKHTDFHKKDKLPLKAFALGETEELMVAQAKKRPCILISKNRTTKHSKEVADAMRGKRHQLASDSIFAPLFGLSCEDDPKGYPALLAMRTRVLVDCGRFARVFVT